MAPSKSSRSAPATSAPPPPSFGELVLAQNQNVCRKGRCKFLDELGAERVAEADRLYATGNVTVSAIWRACKQLDIKISRAPIEKHFKRDCACNG